MPATINGIGTTYAGRRNASARRGECEFCHRVTTLTSYDTREFICFVYIPLIPLTKYRIYDYCASCRKHRRVTHKQFSEQIARDVAPLRDAVQRTPTNVEARRNLIGALLSMRMYNDAETAAREAVAAIPNDASLNRLAGLILSQKGDLPGAQAFLERAVHFDASDAAARVSLGRVLYLQKQYSEAVRHLEEARRLAPSDSAAPVLLANSYMELQRWTEALHVWQAIPNPDRSILRNVAACKKQLGYQLTDAERKASRRWWPFGGKKTATITPVRPNTGGVQPKRLLILGGVLIAIITISLGAIAISNMNGVDVWFDTTLPHTTFIIDSERVTLETPHTMRHLKDGNHKITVLNKKGTKIEERTITVKTPNLLEAIGESRAYVYNTAGLRVYALETIGYSPSEANRSRKTAYYADSFFEVDGVDYMFTEAPDTIQMSSSSTVEYKKAFVPLAKTTIIDYANFRLEENNFEEAEKAYRAATKWNVCDLQARRGLSTALAGRHKIDESVKVVKDGIEQCADDIVDGHRAYQEALLRVDREADAINEYRAAVNAHPDSAMYHYLYGRLLGTFDASIAEQRAAIRVDPDFGWAHCALGYALLGTGAYDEARREFGKGVEGDQFEATAPLYWTYASIASKHPEEIPKSDEWEIRWLTALASKEWSLANALYKERAKESDSWWYGVQLYKNAGDAKGFAQYVERASTDKDVAGAVALAHIEDALEKGDWSEAIAATDASRRKLGGTYRLFGLYAAAAAMMKGDQANASERIKELTHEIDSDKNLDSAGRNEFHAEAGALDGSMKDDAVINAMHDDVLMLKHIYFFLGARASASGNAARAKEMFRRSEAQSFDLDFPLLASRRLASR